jgi:hypothetical protein
MVFYANLKDPISKSLFSGLPNPNFSFTNTQWSTTNELHFGVPIPVLRAHVGKHLQSGSRRGGSYIVDAHGHNLLTAPGLRCGHIQRNHNGICSTISDGLSEALIPHRGWGTDRFPIQPPSPTYPVSHTTPLAFLQGVPYSPSRLLQRRPIQPNEVKILLRARVNCVNKRRYEQKEKEEYLLFA